MGWLADGCRPGLRCDDTTTPFMHNAARRHHIPRARYQVRNGWAYEAGLKRRGDLTVWIDEMAVAG